MAAFFKDRPKITDDSYSTDPPLHGPKCGDVRWNAPKEDKDAQKRSPSVTSAINDWCEEQNGQKVAKEVVHWKKWESGDTFWLAARHSQDTTDSAC